MAAKIEDPRRLRTVLNALRNEHRLKILAMLSERPMHVYELAKRLGISYPLAYMHVAALERAGRIEGEYVAAGGRRQRRVYRVVPFEIVLTPEKIREIVERGEDG